MVERIPSCNPKSVGKIRYEAYLSLLYSLLDGGMSVTSDGGKYEDRVRSLLGHGAYELATMDKLISHIWKDVQTMASDENMWNLVHLYRRHLVTGSFHPEAFRQEAAYISEGEPLYAFQHCPMHHTDESVLHIEYVGILDDDDPIDDPMDEVFDDSAMPLSKRTKR
jgi:C-terminal domain of Sin3a protein